MRALSILGASLVAVLIATQSGVAFPAASGSPLEGPVPTVVHPLAGPSWSVTSVCGGTTHAGRVEPGPTCSPNPPDVIPASINQGSIYATSAQTGQVLFWDSGWENHPGAAYQQTWEFDNGTWTNDTTATGSSHPNPEPNAEVGCMTWDPLGDYFLALSGMTALGATGGVTWAFSNHQWTNLSTDIPDFGGTCAMAWDYADNEAVAYFINSAFTAAYTYVWTGEGWNDITNSSGTPALGCVAGNGMAWDAYDREVVSFGGQRACSTSQERELDVGVLGRSLDEPHVGARAGTAGRPVQRDRRGLGGRLPDDGGLHLQRRSGVLVLRRRELDAGDRRSRPDSRQCLPALGRRHGRGERDHRIPVRRATDRDLGLLALPLERRRLLQRQLEVHGDAGAGQLGSGQHDVTAGQRHRKPSEQRARRWSLLRQRHSHLEQRAGAVRDDPRQRHAVPLPRDLQRLDPGPDR